MSKFIVIEIFLLLFDFFDIFFCQVITNFWTTFIVDLLIFLVFLNCRILYILLIILLPVFNKPIVITNNIFYNNALNYSYGYLIF